MQKQNSVQSLERAFSLLEALAYHPDGLSLTELSTSSGLHKSTAHRLLASLAQLGYVRQTQEGKHYRLTFKLLELSGHLTDNIDILSIARPFLEQLRDQTGETVHLVVRDGSDIVYVFKAESRGSSFRMFSRIGTRREMYCTASGKSMLAALPDSAVINIWNTTDINPYTEHTITTLEGLLAELKAIRRQGYALDNEENELGVRCIAASLADYSGEYNAAFSISAPLVRMPDERVVELSREVLQTRAKISAELGCRL